MFSLWLLWVFAGLGVLYYIGINEIIASLRIEAALSDNRDDFENPVVFALTLFLVVLVWPLIWMEYCNRYY